MTGTWSWSDWWYAGVNTPDGDFSLASEFASCCPPGVLDPNDLIGMTIMAEFLVDFGLIGTCAVFEDSWGTVTDAHIVVQTTVAVEPTTWGTVKALYR